QRTAASQDLSGAVPLITLRHREDIAGGSGSLWPTCPLPLPEQLGLCTASFEPEICSLRSATTEAPAPEPCPTARGHRNAKPTTTARDAAGAATETRLGRTRVAKRRAGSCVARQWRGPRPLAVTSRVRPLSWSPDPARQAVQPEERARINAETRYRFTSIR
ncbi:unnamed protein product, partial [Rangifer tarandus platyrhynchus]